MILSGKEIRIQSVCPEIVHQLLVIGIALLQWFQISQIPQHVFFWIMQPSHSPIGRIHILIIIGQRLVQECDLVFQCDMNPEQEILAQFDAFGKPCISSKTGRGIATEIEVNGIANVLAYTRQ